jgi:uncharacterized protein (DUF2336 family)
MIVRRFLAWADTAPATARAAATGALARAYLYAPMSPAERAEAEAALTVALDDPSPLVRLALAEAFGGAADAPRHIVHALAEGQSDIAAIVLSRSSLFGDGDLIQAAATGDALVQTAIAIRADLSAPVAAALAEVGEPEAVAALAGNHDAPIPAFSMARMVERFGEDGAVREALLARPDLPATVHQSIVVAVSRSLSGILTQRNWMNPARSEAVTRDEAERGTLTLAAQTDDAALPDFVAHLRATSQLTPGLLLRGLLGGDLRLFLGALVALSGMAPRRVAALAAEPPSAGFAALCRKAGLPDGLVLPFRLAVEACTAEIAEMGRGKTAFGGRRITSRVIEGCLAAGEAPDGPVLLMLRRLEADASRAEARAAARRMVDNPEEALDFALIDAPVTRMNRVPLRAEPLSPIRAGDYANVA